VPKTDSFNTVSLIESSAEIILQVSTIRFVLRSTKFVLLHHRRSAIREAASLSSKRDPRSASPILAVEDDIELRHIDTSIDTRTTRTDIRRFIVTQRRPTFYCRVTTLPFSALFLTDDQR
jgi:hypothetical protein